MKHRQTLDRIKMNKASVVCGTISSNITFMNLEFLKEKRKGRKGTEKNLGRKGTEKNFEEIMATIFPNLMKIINPQIQGAQIQAE